MNFPLLILKILKWEIGLKILWLPKEEGQDCVPCPRYEEKAEVAFLFCQ
jgi:hypothetical protein